MKKYFFLNKTIIRSFYYYCFLSLFFLAVLLVTPKFQTAKIIAVDLKLILKLPLAVMSPGCIFSPTNGVETLLIGSPSLLL